MIIISGNVVIGEQEVVIRAVRSQGAGGQNVNKVSTAISLFFDIRASSLPDAYKTRLLQLADRRITKQGVVVLKAQEHRSQEMNRSEAVQRLQQLIQNAMVVQKRRTKTKPSKNARKKRMDGKTLHSRTKKLRGRIRDLT